MGRKHQMHGNGNFDFFSVLFGVVVVENPPGIPYTFHPGLLELLPIRLPPDSKILLLLDKSFFSRFSASQQ